MTGMKSIKSSVIKAYDYDSKSQTMTVEFHSGDVYEYLDVPSTTFRRFLAAPSAGAFFNSTIKPKHKSEYVKPDSQPEVGHPKK